jgi:hypothetical protein
VLTGNMWCHSGHSYGITLMVRQMPCATVWRMGMKPDWHHTAQRAHPPTRFLPVMEHSSGPNDPTTRKNTAEPARNPRKAALLRRKIQTSGISIYS